MRTFSLRALAVPATVCLLVAAGACGGGSGSSGGASGGGTPMGGGTLLAGIPSNPDHLDGALSATTEGWEILEATNDGLMTFRRAGGGAGSQVVPDLATALPKITDGGLVYTFHVRPGVRFSPPVSRAVRPSDVKWSIERILKINSPNVSWYTGIVGATAYEAGKAKTVPGIVANDKAMTVSFHLTKPDGTFLEYMALPPAFVYPAGTPARDVSTLSQYRVATGPYMISSYTPSQQVMLTRNPNFQPWPNTPDGHLAGVKITVGITPEQAVNETADGQLDWYFLNPPPDRLAQIERQYPKQLQKGATGEIEYFSMNERKYPFDKLAVRQAVNYASNRQAMLKLEGGQGDVSENVIPPSFGSAYQKHTFYPYDPAKAKQLIQGAGVAGAHVTVWVLNTDPYPNVAQYMASVLNSLGMVASVKVVDASVYWDLIATEKNDPQIAYNNWSQDFPEGEDFVDTQLNGEGIVNVGNNNQSNVNIPAYNKLIDKARQMPLGEARNALWAKLDADYMRTNAPWVVFMNAARYKFVSARLHGLVFNGTYYDLFPSMWLSQ
ncbi:MAG TPA: ABC transporter substrate-binding protein [Gaiellales bacterium]|nr:ABC transporter substrate-binding protein [Gaiellales bacterium]